MSAIPFPTAIGVDKVEEFLEYLSKELHAKISYESRSCGVFDPSKSPSEVRGGLVSGRIYLKDKDLLFDCYPSDTVGITALPINTFEVHTSSEEEAETSRLYKLTVDFFNKRI
jgi:hypothetical protein